MKKHKCPGCKIRFDFPFFVKERVVDGRWAFHFKDTHGILPELLVEWLNGRLR